MLVLSCIISFVFCILVFNTFILSVYLVQLIWTQFFLEVCIYVCTCEELCLVGVYAVFICVYLDERQAQQRQRRLRL